MADVGRLEAQIVAQLNGQQIDRAKLAKAITDKKTAWKSSAGALEPELDKLITLSSTWVANFDSKAQPEEFIYALSNLDDETGTPNKDGDGWLNENALNASYNSAKTDLAGIQSTEIDGATLNTFVGDIKQKSVAVRSAMEGLIRDVLLGTQDYTSAYTGTGANAKELDNGNTGALATFATAASGGADAGTGAGGTTKDAPPPASGEVKPAAEPPKIKVTPSKTAVATEAATKAREALGIIGNVMDGDKDTNVPEYYTALAAQQMLKSKGYDIAVDGDWGPLTQGALEAWKKTDEGRKDGAKLLDDKQLATLGVMYNTKAQEAYGKEIAKVVTLQTFLNKQLNLSGEAALATDGVYGSKTAEAVKQLQKKLNIQQDGIFGPETASKALQAQYELNLLLDESKKAAAEASAKKLVDDAAKKAKDTGK